MINITRYGYYIEYDGKTIPISMEGTIEEKRASAEQLLERIKAQNVPKAEPLPVLSETDEAILNTNANVEYLVALKELEV